MNTHLIMSLYRARILEAHRLARLQSERPPCVPRINEKRHEIAGIDALLNREVKAPVDLFGGAA